MDISPKPLFSNSCRAHNHLPAKLPAQTLKPTTGMYEDNAGLEVAKEDSSQFTDSWILVAGGRTQKPPLLPAQFLFDSHGSLPPTASVYTHPKTSEFGMMLSYGLRLRPRLMGVNHNMCKRVGSGTNAGKMAFVASDQSKDYVNGQAAPGLVFGMESHVDLSNSDKTEVALGEHWTLRGGNATKDPDPPAPIKDGGNPKHGHQSSKSSSAERVVGAISETKKKQRESQLEWSLAV